MGLESTRTIRVLWLRATDSDDTLVDELIGQQTELHSVETVDQAVAALRRESFDLVIHGSGDFLPLERLHAAPEAQVILETVPQGICIISRDGSLVWANPKMLEFDQALRDEVCKLCLEAFPSTGSISPNRPGFGRAKRISITTPEKRHFEVTATPVIDLNNQMTQVSAMVWDATTALRLQERIDAIDAAGRELVSLDADQMAKLDISERLGLLEQKIIRHMRDLMHIDNFAVRVLDRRTRKLELVLAAGVPKVVQNMELFAAQEGNGISGFVAHRGRSYICPDVRNDPRYLPGIDAAASSLTVPLRMNDQIIGVFNVESSTPAAFGEDDRQLLEIFARYVAFSLHILQLLVTERSTATGKIGSDVMAEITAPLNDILTEVEVLIEDYIGHDDLRHRLNKISENAVAVRDSIKNVTSPKSGIIKRRHAGSTRNDPLLAGKRVLIADDEDLIRETVRDVLISYGCEVAAATDGAEAIRLIAEQPFDLVLSDIRMPHASGYDVFAASKDADPQRPVMLMTGFGYDPNHSVVRARRKGLSAVLFKPFKVEQLLGEIRNALRGAAAPTTGS